MDTTAFRKRIKKELQKMNRKQQIFFAWLSAVRALPFLSKRGGFYYWIKEDRQRHLYAVFRVLDVNQYYLEKSITAAAAYAAADAAAAAADAAADANAAYAYAAAAVADAAYAATDAAYAYAAAAANATARVDYNIRDILLNDAQNIQKGHTTFKNYLELYGTILENFLQALDNEHCTYWGNLYKDIFKNNFVLDKESLERRMNVPAEIQDLGAAAVAGYLEDLEKQGAKHLNEARIIILGEKGAGKTCLARRLKNPNAAMTTDEESTAGVDSTLWKLEHDDINVHIWDFAGHVVTHAVHQLFLSERCLYIIVYDGRTEERNRLEYWLNHIKNYGGDSKVFILVNRRDNHSCEIPINSLREAYPNIVGFYDFSIKTDSGKLEEFRKDITAYIKNNPSWSNLNIPANDFKVKEELELLFTQNNKDCIDLEEFKKVAKKNGVDDIDRLLKNLHALGICLRYKKVENYNTLVLNPEWISQGIYKIINWVHNENKYSISVKDFSAVFEQDIARYPEDKYSYFFELMKTYELAYETGKRSSLIIPHLLHKDRPKELPDFPDDETLMIRYKANQPLPPNTISRFIVRHNEEIKKGYSPWRYGVVVEDKNGSIALVREEDRMICVSVKGNDKTAYLSKLRETLNDIFNSYKSKKPELQYKIEGPQSVSGLRERVEPLWLSEAAISNLFVKKPSYYFDADSGREIPIQVIVNYYYYYHITGGEQIFGGKGNIIKHQTFNLENCNITLQGNLNDLASLLEKQGDKEEADELKDAATMLDAAEKYKTPEELKKKGILDRLKRLVEDLGDENSTLYKKVEGVRNGIRIAQDIGKGYNDIAQWCGLPQIPRPFLGNN
ncbi:MAG: hypothetical protein LBM07_04995 [Culturomica sp.]|jgi:hypothetical protein|nr:hypothetical protein [Culturomica sp.]